MATGFKSWDTSAANNATADSSINWQEGQLPPTVNNSARAMMAILAVWRDNIGFGTVSGGTVGGTANAITLTVSPTIEARTAGRRYLFKYTSTGVTGAATLAVDALSAAAIQYLGAALVSGDIATNDWVLVVDDGTNFQLLSKPRVSTYNISGLAEDTVGAVGDFLATYDISTSLPKKLLFSTLQTLLKASQGQAETPSSDAVFMTPLRTNNHPGVAKASGHATVTTGTPTLVTSHNVTSITDSGEGRLTVTIATDFSSTSYTVLHGTELEVSTEPIAGEQIVSAVVNGTQAAGAFMLVAFDTTNGYNDPAAWHFSASGDQA